MSNIYLLTSDGHRDSTGLQYYARSESELIELLIKEEKDNLVIDIKNIKVDFERQVITYLKKDYLDETEYYSSTYHFFTLETVDNFKGVLT